MMAMSEDRHGEAPPAGLKKVALAALFGLILLFSMGVVAGASFALVDGTSKGPIAVIMIAVGLAAGLLSIWGLLRLKPWAGNGEPMSPKTRKANNLLLASGALGGVLGAVLAISTVSLDEPFALFSNSPMSPGVVVLAIAVWLLVVPLLSWQWHRSIDEHETDAYQVGGLIGLYLYAFLVPAWWFAWRGGLVPAPDTMVVYLIVMSIWGLGWFWRRYR